MRDFVYLENRRATMGGVNLTTMKKEYQDYFNPDAEFLTLSGRKGYYDFRIYFCDLL